MAAPSVAQTNGGPSAFCHQTDGQFTVCPGGSQEWSDIPFACATKTRLNTTIVCHFLMSQVAQNSARLRQHNHRVLPRQIPDGRSFSAKPWGVGKSVVKSLSIYLKSAPLWMGTNYATEELR